MEIDREVDARRGRQSLLSTLASACLLCGYSDYIVDLGFIVRPAPLGIVALLRGPEIHTFSPTRFSTMGAFH